MAAAPRSAATIPANLQQELKDNPRKGFNRSIFNILSAVKAQRKFLEHPY